MLPPAYPKRAGRAIRRCLLIGSIFVGCSADGPGPVQTAVHESDSTWDIIQTEIFAGQCVSCHTAGTSFGRQSGLVLTPDMAYEQLVGAAPTNAAAAADGMLRVSDLGQGMPGLLKSYLWEKINAPDLLTCSSFRPTRAICGRRSTLPTSNTSTATIGLLRGDNAP